MTIPIQSSSRRLNHRLPHGCAIDPDGFLCPNDVVDEIESGIAHGNAESFGNVEKLPVLASLVPNVDPNAAPGGERDRFEYIYKVGDVFPYGRFFSEFAGIRSIKALLIIRW